MIFTPEQLDAYHATGYTTAPTFFDAREVAAMLAELDRLCEAGHNRNVVPEGYEGGRQNIQIIPLNDKSRLFRSLPFTDRVRAAVDALIGGPAVHWLDQIFLKPARHGEGTGWHQDNGYFGFPNATHGLGMWVALHEATVDNGTMHVVPWTGDDKLEHVAAENSDHHITCTVDESKVVPVELPAGGVLFFHNGVPHCTRANNTDADRAGLALHFVHADQVGQSHASHRNPDRQPFLSGPEFAWGEPEFGERLMGVWQQEVEARQGVCA